MSNLNKLKAVFGILVNILGLISSKLIPISTCQDMSTENVSILDTTTRTTEKTNYFDFFEDYQPDKTVIGISGFSLGSLGLNFDLNIQSVTNKGVTFQVNAYNGCSLVDICFSMLLIQDPAITLVPYNFNTHPNFTTSFSTSNDAELEYNVSYVGDTSIDWTDATAYVVFNAIQSDHTRSKHHFDYQIISVNGNTVNLKIKKYDDASLLRLRGTIIIVAKSAETTLGYDHGHFKISNPPFLGTKFGYNTQISVGSRNDYTKGPALFMTLSGIHIGTTIPRMHIRGYIGIDDTDFPILTLIVSKKSSTAAIEMFSQNVLLFCRNGNDCLTSQQIDFVAGTVDFLLLETIFMDFIALPRYAAVTIAYPYFFQSSVSTISVGVGFGNIAYSQGCKVEIMSASRKSVMIQVSVEPYQTCGGGKITYIASGWEGVQIRYVNFSSHGDFLTISGLSSTRVLEYEVEFPQSNELGSQREAFLLFSEVSTPVSGGGYFNYEIPYIGVDRVSLRLILTDEDAFPKLAGFLVIHNADSSPHQIVNLNLRNNALWDSYPGFRLRRFSVELPNKYITRPIIIAALNYLNLGNASFVSANIYAQIDIFPGNCSSNLNIWEYLYNSDLLDSGATIFVFYPSKIGTFARTAQVLLPVAVFNPSSYQVFCIQRVINPGMAYVVMVTDEATVTNMPYFKTSARAVPRIITTSLAVKLADNYAQVIFPPFPTPQTGILSYHFIQLMEDKGWGLAGYPSDTFHTFPLLGWTDKVTFDGNITEPGVFPGYTQSYKTMVATKLYRHDQSVSFSCTLSIHVSGIIRKAHFNGDVVIVGSSIDPIAGATFFSFKECVFNPNELAVLTIIGYKLKINTVEFQACSNGGLPVNPTFKSFIIPPYGLDKTSHITFSTVYINCPPNCQACVGTTCVECMPGFRLDKDQCRVLCEDNLIPVKNGYCGQLSFAGMRLQNPSYVDNKINIQYELNLFFSTSYLLVGFFPYETAYGNYPGILSSLSNPSLPEATYDIITTNSADQIITITTSKEITPIMISNNLRVNILVYGLEINTILIGKYQLPDEKKAISLVYLLNIYGTYDVNANYFFHFVLVCPDGCTLTFDFSGALVVYVNERTITLSIYHLIQTKFDVKRIFRGTNYFKLLLSNSDYFGFTINGAYQIYAPTNFVLEDFIEISSTTTCHIDQCNNCVSDTECLSCNEFFFLTPTKEACLDACTSGIASAGERRCLCQLDTDCPLQQYSKCGEDGFCYPCTSDANCAHLFPLQIETVCASGTCVECVSHCVKCSNEESCEQCADGYHIENEICYIDCPEGETNIAQYECGEKCGDGKRSPIVENESYCDDGNMNSGDGCSSECKIESGYTCFGGSLAIPDTCYLLLSFTLKMDPHQSKVILIQFNKPIKSTAKILSDFAEITLSNTDSSDYSYAIEKIDSYTFKIIFEITKTLEPQDLTLTFSSPELILDKDDLPLSKLTDTIQIDEMRYSSEEDDILTKNVVRTVKAVSILGSAASGLLLVFSGSNLSFIWFFLAILQKYYYLSYLNIEYPENIVTFLKVLSFARLEFVPNIALILNPDLSETDGLSTPEKFKETGLDGLLLVNTGSIMTIWILMVFSAIVILIIEKFAKNFPGPVVKYFSIRKKNLFWSGFLRNWMATYFELSIAACLQLRSHSWTTVPRSMSMLLAILFFIANIALIAGGSFFIKMIRRYLVNSRTYATLFQELKDQPPICKYYNMIVLARRFLASMVFVFFYDYTFLQMFCLITIDVFHLVFLLAYRPYKGTNEQLAISIDEGLYLIVFGIITLLHYWNETTKVGVDSKMSLGWVVIGICATSLLTSVVYILIENFKTFKEIYHKLVNKKKTKNTTRHVKRVKSVKTAQQQKKLATGPITKTVHNSTQAVKSPRKKIVSHHVRVGSVSETRKSHKK